MPQCYYCCHDCDESRIAYQTSVAIVENGRVKQVETMSLCRECTDKLQEQYTRDAPRIYNVGVDTSALSVSLAIMICGLLLGILAEGPIWKLVGFASVLLTMLHREKACTEDPVPDTSDKSMQVHQKRFASALDAFSARKASEKYNNPAYAVERRFFSPEYSPQRLKKETGMPLSAAKELREILDRSRNGQR